MTTSVRRNQIVSSFGTPSRTQGSVNEPRVRQELGFRYNEKWIYDCPRNDPAHAHQRIIYWLRYDFVGSAIVRVAGAAPEVDADFPAWLAAQPSAGVPGAHY